MLVLRFIRSVRIVFRAEEQAWFGISVGHAAVRVENIKGVCHALVKGRIVTDMHLTQDSNHFMVMCKQCGKTFCICGCEGKYQIVDDLCRICRDNIVEQKTKDKI